VLHLRLIIFLIEGDDSVDNEMFLVTDFINFKIKTTQSFGDAHRIGYVCVFIEVSNHTCISICTCTVFLKKRNWSNNQIEPSTLRLSYFIIKLILD
jgi:hypothetical protein